VRISKNLLDRVSQLHSSFSLSECLKANNTLFIDSLDHDASNPNSSLLHLLFGNVWSSVEDVGPECLWFSDTELLLVAFDS
nr:hypothetical protein [Tanacetum cinerariifolium]